MRGYSGPEHKSPQRLIAQSLIHNKRLSVTRPHSKSPVNQRQLVIALALVAYCWALMLVKSLRFELALDKLTLKAQLNECVRIYLCWFVLGLLLDCI